MEIKGTIILINETETITAKFQKREFVVESEGEYPQPILIQMVQDKCSLLDGYAVGDKVTVAYNLNGRKWESPLGEVKYFNSIVGWKIDKS